MPALSNARHELFCQELAKGKSQVEAHEAAGFKAHRGNASSLAQTKNILERVAEIQAEHAHIARAAIEKAAERLSIDREWVLATLVENVNRAMQAVEVKDHKGKGTGEYKYEGSVANAALNLIGKELGMFVDKTENVNLNHDVSDRPATEEEWAAEHAVH